MADVCKDNACEITPLSAFLSTNLNNKIETYGRLGDRVKRGLGYPLVSLEIHPDQLNEIFRLLSSTLQSMQVIQRSF